MTALTCGRIAIWNNRKRDVKAVKPYARIPAIIGRYVRVTSVIKTKVGNLRLLR